MATNHVQAGDDGSTLAPLLAVVERRFDEFVGFAVERTLRGAGDRYAGLAAEQLQASIRRGLRAVLTDLRDGGAAYTEFWREISVVRARAGFAIDALQQALDLNEALLVGVARQLPELGDQLAAITALHRVHNAARRAQFSSYAVVSAEIEAEQRAALERLGAPVIPVYGGIVLVPLTGASAALQVGDTLLAAVQEHRARFVVLDVTGLATIDADVARAIERAGQGVRLLGAELLLVGMSPAAAAAVVTQGVTLALAVFRDLQSGFEHALARMGLEIAGRRAMR